MAWKGDDKVEERMQVATARFNEETDATSIRP